MITPEHDVKNEIETCQALLANGIHGLHVRKPGWDKDRLKGYVEKLGTESRNMIRLHEHHECVSEMNLGGKHYKGDQPIIADQVPSSKSFHTMEEVQNADLRLDYCFLSPVFNSISKIGYQSAFDLNELSKGLRGHKVPVYALGGVTPDKISELRSTGFDGVVLMGAIWKENELSDRLKVVEEALNA